MINPKNQLQLLFETEDEETRKRLVNPSDPSCPFHNFVGNTNAVKRLCRAAYAAIGKENHECSDFSFALIGPASTGKTTLVRKFAELVELPLVEIQPQMLSSVNDVLAVVAEVCENTKRELDGNTYTLELMETEEGNRTFILPPMIIFIDEVHALRSNVVQGLLKATEPKDRIMKTEKDWTVDCRHVCWIIATTDRGQLFDAFDTRFTKISLKLYSRREIAKIIQLNFPTWDWNVCSDISKYVGHVPREAIQFANDAKLEKEISGDPWDIVLKRLAEEHGIDPYGLTYQRLKILTALGQEPVARDRLSYVAQCKPEELKKFIMPTMLTSTNGEPAIVNVSSQGYIITDAGREELDKRNISHVEY